MKQRHLKEDCYLEYLINERIGLSRIKEWHHRKGKDTEQMTFIKKHLNNR